MPMHHSAIATLFIAFAPLAACWPAVAGEAPILLPVPTEIMPAAPVQVATVAKPAHAAPAPEIPASPAATVAVGSTASVPATPTTAAMPPPAAPAGSGPSFAPPPLPDDE